MVVMRLRDPEFQIHVQLMMMIEGWKKKSTREKGEGLRIGVGEGIRGWWSAPAGVPMNDERVDGKDCIISKKKKPRGR